MTMARRGASIIDHAAAGAARRARSGFTLIEMVVAGVILALLAAITIPQVMDALDKKRITDTYELLQEIQYAFTNSDQTGFLNVVRTGVTVSTSSVVPGSTFGVPRCSSEGNLTGMRLPVLGAGNVPSRFLNSA